MLATAPQPPVRQFVTASRHLFVTCHSTYRRGKACLDHDEDDDHHHEHNDHHQEHDDHHREHDDDHTFKDGQKSSSGPKALPSLLPVLQLVMQVLLLTVLNLVWTLAAQV